MASEGLQISISPIPTSADLGKIIDAYVKASASISKITSSVTKMSDSVKDGKEFDRAAKTAQKIITGVDNFTTSILDVMETLSKGFPADKMDELNKLYIDANEYRLDKDGNRIKDKDGKDIIGKSGSTVPVMLVKIADSFSNINKSIESLGKSNFDIAGIVMTKVNMTRMSDNLKDLVSTIQVAFSGIANDANFKEMLEVLVSDPETIEDTRDVDQWSDGKGATKLIDKSKQITTKGKIGLLEVINTVLGIIASLGSIEPPNPITFKMKLSMSMSSLRMLLEEMIDITKTMGDDLKTMPDFGKNMEALQEMVDQLPQTIETISSIGTPKNYIKVMIASAIMDKMEGFLIKIDAFFSSKAFQNLAAKDKQDKLKADLKGIADNVSALDDIASGMAHAMGMVILAGIIAIPATIAMLGVGLFMLAYAGVLRLMSWIFGDANMESTMQAIENAKKAAINITISMLMLTGVILLWALTGEFIKSEWKNIFIVAGFVLFVMVVFWAISWINEKLKASKDITKLALTVLLLSMVVLLWALTGELVMQEWQNILIMGVFVLIVAGFFWVIGLIMERTEGNKSILMLALSIVLISLVVLLWAWTGEYAMTHWVEIIVMSVFVAVLIGLMFLLDKSTNNIQKGAVSILLAVGAFVLMGLLVYLYVDAGQKILDNMGAIIAMSVFIVALLAIVVILGVTRDYTIAGAAVILILAGALFLAAAAIGVLAAASKALTLESVGLMCLFLVGIGASVAALGAMSIFVALGAAALIILGAAMLVFMPPMLLFVGAMKIVKGLNAKKEDVTRPIDLMADLVGAINRNFGGIRGTIRLARAAGKALLLIPIAISIGIIAKVLQSIASLNIPTEFDKDGKAIAFQKMSPDDFAEASENAANITFVLASIFGESVEKLKFGGKTVTIKPISEKALENITGTTARKMCQLARITSAIGNMAETLQNIASLNIPDPTAGWTSEGKPKGYKQMEAADFAMAAENAANIAVMLSSIFGEKNKLLFIKGKAVLIHCISEEALDNITRGARNKMERLAEITSAIGNMATVLQSVASLNMPIEFDKKGKPTAYKQMGSEEFTAASKNVVDIMTLLLEAVGSEEMSNMLEKLDDDAAENFATVLKGCEGLQSLMNAIKDSVEIKPEDIAAGVANIKSALSAYIKVLNDLFIGTYELKPKTGWLGFEYNVLELTGKPEVVIDDLEDAKDGLNAVLEAVNSTVPIIDNLKTMSENADSVNPTKISDIINNYIAAVYGDENGKGGIKIGGNVQKQNGQLRFMIDQQERISKIDVQKMQKNTESFIKFVDKANSIDTSKLTTVRDMFEQMARFSESVQGDFEKLADVLSEKLVDILDKLNTTIENVQNMPAPVASTGAAAPVASTGAAAVQAGKQAAQTEKPNQAIERLIGYIDGIEGALDNLNSTVNSIKNQGLKTRPV